MAMNAVGTLRGAGAPNYLDAVRRVSFGVIGGVEHALATSYSDHALVVVDVSTPSSPTLAGVLRGAGAPNYLDGARDVAFGVIGGVEHAVGASYSNSALVVVDVSTPSSPTLAGVLRGGGAPNYLNTASGVAFGVIGGVEHALAVGYSESAVVVVDVSTPSSPTLAGVLQGTGAPNYLGGSVAVAFGVIGGVEHAVAAGSINDALVVVDVSTPSSPTLAGVLRGAGAPNYLDGVGGVEFATIGGVEHALAVSYTDDALAVVDVSTPSSPTLAGVLRGAGAPNYLDGVSGVSFGVIGGVEYALAVSVSEDALVVVGDLPGADAGPVPSAPRVSSIRAMMGVVSAGCR